MHSTIGERDKVFSRASAWTASRWTIRMKPGAAQSLQEIQDGSPVGVGKTFMATALGHIACRRRISVHFERHDRLHKRLKAARLDASYDHEMRKLIGVDLLVIDHFALQPLDMLETADVYELCVERHHAKATVLTSNRDPSEWLETMADPLLAQSAVDRLESAAWELVIEGESYR